MNLIEILLLSMSLSVDTLVVSLGGSVSLGRISPGKVLKVSLAFGLMQAGLIFLGWLAGASVASFIHKAAHIIGFVILLYIGGSMIWSAMRKSEERTDLCGIRNLLLAAWDKGIGSCWLSAPQRMGFGPALQECFAPDKGEFVAMVTLGYPDQAPKAIRLYKETYH